MDAASPLVLDGASARLTARKILLRRPRVAIRAVAAAGAATASALQMVGRRKHQVRSLEVKIPGLEKWLHLGCLVWLVAVHLPILAEFRAERPGIRR